MPPRPMSRPPAPSLFEGLTAVQPYEKLKLETTSDQLSMRALDMIAPIGRGQRGLIVAPPRTGKTILLQQIAKAVLANHPEVAVIVLLVDERPEEVTDFKMQIGKQSEIVASSNDNPYRRHIEVTEQVLDRAKRMVEEKRDVLILFDSLTRMTRAYNNELSSRGRTMSGAIIGTVLVDTGSRMDQIIFEEFKGTGNMELYLSRELSDRRIFPSFDLMRSGTRREELLFSEEDMKKIHLLRRALSGTKPQEAMEAMLGRLKLTATNKDFLRGLGA
jgi:transcription termination factor Rho